MHEGNMKIKVAFFKGDKKSWMHRFIRWYTKSPYSHAELIMPDDVTWVGISPFLTSKVDERTKVEVDIEEWDYLTFDLSWREPVRNYQVGQLKSFIAKTMGSSYDWTGMILSNLSPYLIKKRDKWYCSEWIAHALVNSRVVMWDDLHLYDTPDMSPGRLYNMLSRLANKDVQ